MPEIGVKQNLWSTDILQKLHAWEQSRSQVVAKNVSWPMRFQYSLIVNINRPMPTFDFWNACKNFFKILHNERSQQVGKSNVNGFKRVNK